MDINDHVNVISQGIIKRLDLLIGDLSYLGLYDLADRLEELAGDVEEKMLKEGIEIES